MVFQILCFSSIASIKLLMMGLPSKALECSAHDPKAGKCLKYSYIQPMYFFRAKGFAGSLFTFRIIHPEYNVN